MVATARGLLDSLGETITFTRVVESAFDPTDGSVTNGTPVVYTAACAPTQYSKQEIDETLILSNDIRLIIEKPASETPTQGDTCVVDSITYRLMDVTTIRAQGTNILYIAQLRK